MTRHLYRRPASKPRVPITPEIEDTILTLLAEHSQHHVARHLGISQSAVSKVVRRRKSKAIPPAKSSDLSPNGEVA